MYVLTGTANICGHDVVPQVHRLPQASDERKQAFMKHAIRE
jgi:hypothetical protein